MERGERRPEPPSPATLRLRKWVLAALTLNAALVGFLGYVSTRRIFKPIVEVPPNRYFTPSSLQILVANVAYSHYALGWLVILVGAGLAILAWKGRLDAYHKPLLFVLIVVCSAHLACILYGETIPFWVERTYGARARARMFGHF